MKLNRSNSSAFVNPSLHLRMFTLRNPVVTWAIAHGAYPDEDRKPCARDVLDEDSLKVARQMGIELSYAQEDQYEEMGSL